MARLNIYKYKRAQTSLETTLALICVLILLFGSIKIFIWFTSRIVHRQEDYELGRAAAGMIGEDREGVYVDESNYPPLDIFGESN